MLQMAMCDGRLEILALEGAQVGPPWSKRQNALVFKEKAPNGISVYYEPHADHNLDSIKSVAPVDVCIVPTTSAYVAGVDRCQPRCFLLSVVITPDIRKCYGLLEFTTPVP
jgi:hypothetical protein